RSRSPYGDGSRRPSPPIAASATPSGIGRDASHSSYASLSAARSGAPTSPGRRSTPARTSASSDRVGVSLTRSHPHERLDSGHPHPAVADRARLGGLPDRVLTLVGIEVVHKDIDAALGDEVAGVFGTAVPLGVPALPPDPLDFADRQALEPEHPQGGFDVVQLDRLDHRRDE